MQDGPEKSLASFSGFPATRVRLPCLVPRACTTHAGTPLRIEGQGTRGQRPRATGGAPSVTAGTTRKARYRLHMSPMRAERPARQARQSVCVWARFTEFTVVASMRNRRVAG